MNDKAMTPTSLRMPDGLLRQLTKAAHKCEMSRTEYINQALQQAVNKTLELDVMNSGAPNADAKMAHALETVLPQLRRMGE